MDKNILIAERIAELVNSKGGRTFYVGGLVRDKILGKENKDVDIEIHNITPENLREVLSEIGTITEMGASFGILGLKGYDIDIAQPRSEKATGRGHKDFEVFVDPFIGTEKAARRRDFTINALMEDVLSGEIVDHFGGLEDLKNGVIRHVDSTTFVEDPLRVLRAAQFAARFEFSVADETIELAKTMDLTTLAKERILEELKKALLKAKKPSIFFETLREMNQLKDWFPEVEQLISVEQSPEHHPEGNVWNHTMMVVDFSATVREKSSNPFFFMMSALCHDFGKIVATKNENGKITAIAHDVLGIPLAETFLNRISNEIAMKKYVLNMVQYHMQPNNYFRTNAGIKVTNKMFDNSICCEDLILLADADHMGRLDAVRNEDSVIFIAERLETYREMVSRPSVTGQDLIDAGVKPGPVMKDMLAQGHEWLLMGVPKEHIMSQLMAEYRRNNK